MRDLSAITGAAGAVVGVVGVCCGPPALLSVGFLGAVAGISLGSWVLIAVAIAAAVVGLWRRPGRRYRTGRPGWREGLGRGRSDDTGAVTDGTSR